MTRTPQQLLLGEWACLGILYPAPTHGFAVAARLKPEGDIGRVWSLSRALTYRALDQLTVRGYVQSQGEEPGLAGGNRTILAVTPAGRVQFGEWLATPVAHLRDLRSELLLKLVLADACAIDITPTLHRQRDHIRRMAEAFAAPGTADVVALWRGEASQAALRFLDTVIEASPRPPHHVQ